MSRGPTPATPRLPAAERRQQLLDVALEAFASQGFHLTSMNELAEQAGVTKPVLYQHFGSKRELYLEVLRAVGGRMVTDVGKAIADAEGPRQQVEAGFLAYFLWVARERHGFEVLFAGDTRRDPEFLAELGKVETEFAQAIAGLIVVDGINREQQLLLAYGIVGIAETTCRHWLAADLDLSARAARPGRLRPGLGRPPRPPRRLTAPGSAAVADVGDSSARRAVYAVRDWPVSRRTIGGRPSGRTRHRHQVGAQRRREQQGVPLVRGRATDRRSATSTRLLAARRRAVEVEPVPGAVLDPEQLGSARRRAAERPVARGS